MQNHHLDNLAIREQLVPLDHPVMDFQHSLAGLALRVYHHADSLINERDVRLRVDDQDALAR